MSRGCQKFKGYCQRQRSSFSTQTIKLIPNPHFENKYLCINSLYIQLCHSLQWTVVTWGQERVNQPLARSCSRVEKVKAYYRPAELSGLHQKSLYLETILHSPCALSPSQSVTAGEPLVDPTVRSLWFVCFPHAHKPRALGSACWSLPRTLLFLNPMEAITPWAHPSLCSLIPALRHHWNRHSYLFSCNSPRIYSCYAILLFWRWICILVYFQK